LLKAPTVLSLCAVLCLYGCGVHHPKAVTQQQVVSQLSQPIAAQLVVKTPELTVEGTLQRTGPEMFTFGITSPDQLDGFCIGVEQQTCSISYGGMEARLHSKLLPEAFGIVTFNRAVDALLRQQEPSFRNTPEGGAVMEGSLDEAAFQIKFDSSGRPFLFTLPQYDLTVEWKQNNRQE